MDIEAIVERFVEQGFDKADAETRVDEYLSIPLELEIEDDKILRLSQVLTNNGYITTDTCEGHGNRLPHAFIRTESQDYLRHLAHILARDSRAANFKWVLRAWSSYPGSNPDSPLSYILEPFDSYENIDPKRDYDKLIQDLDIIGICVMEYCNETKAWEHEQEARRKTKEERGLRNTPERVEELSNLYIIDGEHIAAVKPEVTFIWDGEQDDYKKKGTIVEEFMDGFEIQTDQVVSKWKNPFDDKYGPPEIWFAEEFKLRYLVCEGLVYSFPVKSD